MGGRKELGGWAYCRHVFFWEALGGVGNEEAGLANGAVAHDDELCGVFHQLLGWCRRGAEERKR